MAVAILIVGGAAALYLQSVDHPAPETAGTEPAVALEVRQVAASLSSVAQSVLDGQVANTTTLVGARRAVWDALNRSVADLYPRLGPGGATVGLRVTSLSIGHTLGWVEAPSVFGGNTPEELPIWLSAQGTADVWFGGPGGHVRPVAFAATSTAPASLPLELAARAGAELLPGGTAERFASQAAQHLLPTLNTTSFDTAAAPAVVMDAVQAVLLWAFHESGNATFDARAVRAAGPDGLLTPGELANRTRLDDEAVDLTAAREPFVLEGGGRATLRVLFLDAAGLAITVTRRGFSGQELGPGVWNAVAISARGNLSLTVEVAGNGATARMDGLRLPVAFDAHAALGPLAPELVVPPDRAAAIEAQARQCTATCEVTQFLADLGLAINQTAAMTAAVAHALYAFEAGRMAAALPPVEDANAFHAAYGPARRTTHAQAFRVVGPEVAQGARATVTVDGSPAGTTRLEAGLGVVARMPDGAQTVGVSVPCGDSVCAGGSTTTLGSGSTPIEVIVAPAPQGSFVAAVARRSIEENISLGHAALLEASELLGLAPPTSLPAALASALTRIEALLASGTAVPHFRGALTDAKGFLKVSLLVLKATDAARKAAGGSPVPYGQAAGNLARIVLAPEAQLLLIATIHGSEILRAAMGNGSLEVSTPWVADGSGLSLDFRLEQVGLVATAALAGLTLGADYVRIQNESEQGDTAGVAIAAGRLVGHAADTLRQLGQGLMRVADRFLGTASAKAAATTFAKASIVLGAVFFALDVAELYHEAGGNWSLVSEGLIHPATVAGMLTLPSLAQGAASTAAGALLLLSGQAIAAAGPVGIAAGLFVLAGVILLNGQTFASAAFGALNPAERVAFESAMANRTRDLAHVLAFANGLSPSASENASRASAVAAARLAAAVPAGGDERAAARLAAARDAAVGDALHFARRARAERAIQHAALAAMEQMDDFASGNHTADPGRRTEGYGQLEKVDANQGGWGKFPYGGDLVVQDASSLPTRTLSRDGWRALLPTLQAADLATTTFGYTLTPTDGIPVREAERFIAACATSGELLESALGAYRALSA